MTQKSCYICEKAIAPGPGFETNGYQILRAATPEQRNRLDRKMDKKGVPEIAQLHLHTTAAYALEDALREVAKPTTNA